MAWVVSAEVGWLWFEEEIELQHVCFTDLLTGTVFSKLRIAQLTGRELFMLVHKVQY